MFRNSQESRKTFAEKLMKELNSLLRPMRAMYLLGESSPTSPSWTSIHIKDYTYGANTLIIDITSYGITAGYYQLFFSDDVQTPDQVATILVDQIPFLLRHRRSVLEILSVSSDVEEDPIP
jgi:hypothetical protein